MDIKIQSGWGLVCSYHTVIQIVSHPSYRAKLLACWCVYVKNE